MFLVVIDGESRTANTRCGAVLTSPHTIKELSHLSAAHTGKHKHKHTEAQTTVRMNCMEILLLLGAVAVATASQYKTPGKHDHKFHYGGMYRGWYSRLVFAV